MNLFGACLILKQAEKGEQIPLETVNEAKNSCSSTSRVYCVESTNKGGRE